ncbi:MAG: PD-(D/E)XK nuclease family protein [Paludibacteraceae bacterium]|nr:PD-(D/E)XK nuclease family protein [Paludibacteraceae bacterium]
MNHTFLHYVAKDLYERTGGNDLSRTAVIFPNKRASLFLNEELMAVAKEHGESTMWSPACMTISELFRSESPHITSESKSQLALIYRLYKIFVRHVGATLQDQQAEAVTETFDHFYGWGKMLLADFDDIDKNMGPADKIFSNLADIRQIENISDYLNEKQIDAIENYFGKNLRERGVLRKHFEAVWSKLGIIYREFHNELTDAERNSSREVYEGLLYREVSERIDTLNFDKYEQYAFVGFNMIQKCEESLFRRIRDLGKALFYWDYDRHYVGEQAASQEAGHYIRQWIAKYPNALPDENDEIYDNLGKKKKIRFLSATTEDIQARYVREWTEGGKQARNDRKSAIVLCDEQLLPNVLDALPGTPEAPAEINITMGYPFRITPIATRLYSTSTAYLNDTTQERNLEGLIDCLNETLKQSTEDWQQTDVLGRESLYQAHLLLREMSSTLRPVDQETQLPPPMLLRLFNQLLTSISIPFHGEPARGLQVMGLLETRNLDFSDLLMLSCNEGNMPKGVSDSSFIPYDIRKAYSLTTVDNKVAIYAYYFYSLLQRANDITICYNAATEGTSSGEMSRFMRQMMVEMPDVHIDMESLSYAPAEQKENTQESGEKKTGNIEKTPEMIDYLIRRRTIEGNDKNEDLNGKAFFSPSALNLYISCPARFYFRYLAHLDEPQDEESRLNVDGALFGTLFHDAAEYLYSHLVDTKSEAYRHLDENEKRCLLQNRCDIALSWSLQKNLLEKEQPDMSLSSREVKLDSGTQIICREVLTHLLHRLVEIDIHTPGLQIVAVEQDVSMPITIEAGGRTYTTSIGGRIDRIDSTDNGQSLRIVDYKTSKDKDIKGKKVTNPAEELLDGNFKGEQRGYWFQTILYSLILRQDRRLNPAHKPVSPALMYILSPKAINTKSYDPVLELNNERIHDVNIVAEEFLKKTHQMISELFDIQRPFYRTENADNCKYCPYKPLCRKYKNVTSEEDEEE